MLRSIITEPCPYQKMKIRATFKTVNVGPKAWQANMAIQPVFNEYKTVTLICQYFSKTEDQCSQAIK